jgi:hypothetical protein
MAGSLESAGNDHTRVRRQVVTSNLAIVAAGVEKTAVAGYQDASRVAKVTGHHGLDTGGQIDSL